MFTARSKIFSPLNVGAFELRHRLVVDWADEGVSQWDSHDTEGSARDPWLVGGLEIHAPTSVLWPIADLDRSFRDLATEPAWPALIHKAKTSKQCLVARLSTDVPSYFPAIPEDIALLSQDHIEQIVEHYVGAAKRAGRFGFDGVELDATAGSVSDLFLGARTNGRSDRYGGTIRRRTAFLTELVAALTTVVGRERVGVRLSPFSGRDGEQVRTEEFDETLYALNDLEIAYIHLFDDDRLNHVVDAWPYSAAAAAFRRAHSGILISSHRENLVETVDLVESRWADAICFPAGRLDRKTCEQLRGAWPDDSGP